MQKSLDSAGLKNPDANNLSALFTEDEIFTFQDLCLSAKCNTDLESLV
jgi:hypothetical protein